MKYLIFGSKGQLGTKFSEIFEKRGVIYYGYDYDTCDISDSDSVSSIVKNIRPGIIFNCAAYNLVDEAEKNNKTAFSVNSAGTRNIAQAAKESGAFLVHYGTDYVFDGLKGDVYNENDRTNPVNEYGKSKLEGEKAVMEILKNYMILRLSWVYGIGKQNFVYKFQQWAESNSVLNITEDEFSIPTSTNLIADATLRALNKGLIGTFHLAGSGMASRIELAQEIIKLKDLNVELSPVPISFFNLPAKRPHNSSMSNKLISAEIGNLPDWRDDLKIYLEESDN